MAKKSAKKPKPSTTRDELKRLHARVWYLEQVDQKATAYRRALAVVERREADVREARQALDKAKGEFLGAYLPTEIKYTHTPMTADTAQPHTFNVTWRNPVVAQGA